MNKNSLLKKRERKSKQSVLDEKILIKDKGFKSFQDQNAFCLFSTKSSQKPNFLKKISPLYNVYARNISISPPRIRSLTPKLPKIKGEKKYVPLSSNQFKSVLERYRNNSYVQTSQ